PPPSLEEFISLADERAGFARFFDGLSALFVEKDHRAAKKTTEAAANLFRYCGEILLAKVTDERSLAVLSDSGEVYPLTDLLPGSDSRVLEHDFLESLSHAGIAALGVQSGVQEKEFADIVALLEGPASTRGGVPPSIARAPWRASRISII